MDKHKKKIVFSEIIDSKINGYAIGVSFFLISVFLFVNNTYFYWPILTYIISAFFALIGVAGIGTEIDKSKKLRGLGNIVLGMFCLGVWIATYILLENNPIVNIFGILFFVLGAYGFTRGVMELFYSIWLEIIDSNRTNTKVLRAIFVFLTQICGLILTILNILKIFGVL